MITVTDWAQFQDKVLRCCKCCRAFPNDCVVSPWAKNGLRFWKSWSSDEEWKLTVRLLEKLFQNQFQSLTAYSGSPSRNICSCVILVKVQWRSWAKSVLWYLKAFFGKWTFLIGLILTLTLWWCSNTKKTQSRQAEECRDTDMTLRKHHSAVDQEAEFLHFLNIHLIFLYYIFTFNTFDSAALTLFL